MSTLIDVLMSADADAACGAPYGTSSPERTNVRNGYRHRDFDTRVGTLDVAIPKLRQGSYFPDWLLERRRRAEAALTLSYLSDRQLFIALAQLGFDGLVTNSCKMLDVPEEIAAIVKTKSVVVAVEALGHDPIRAVGALLLELPGLAGRVRPGVSNVFRLNYSRRQR